MNKQNISIVTLTPALYPDFQSHFSRHHLESGQNGYHFMPFIPGDHDKPRGMAVNKLLLSLYEKNWQRGWVAIDESTDRVIAHVNLKGGELKTSMHRCELGLGIETDYRRQGLGEKLLQQALRFARQESQLEWVDLRTFGSNSAAQALYRKLGFAEIGRVAERFRINDLAIDDIQMTLCVRQT